VKTYRGIRRNGVVAVWWSEGDRSHGPVPSPFIPQILSGVCYDFATSGPGTGLLARALLLDSTGDLEAAHRWWPLFVHEWLALCDPSDVVITQAQIWAWLHEVDPSGPRYGEGYIIL
jgi:hypothetical protein